MLADMTEVQDPYRAGKGGPLQLPIGMCCIGKEDYLPCHVLAHGKGSATGIYLKFRVLSIAGPCPSVNPLVPE